MIGDRTTPIKYAKMIELDWSNVECYLCHLPITQDDSAILIKRKGAVFVLACHSKCKEEERKTLENIWRSLESR